MCPDVSILIPVYNVSRFIEKCAVSLFEQSAGNIEFLFFDDCSPDNSIAILQKVIERYPHRAGSVRIMKGEVNQGLAAARNALIDAATGRYILHVDSDDYLEFNCVEVLLGAAMKEEADIVVSDIFREKNNATTIQHILFSTDKGAYIQLLLSSLSPSYNCGKLISRRLYRDHSIRCKVGVNVLEDYHTFPRLAYFATKIVKVNLPLYHYIQYNENAYTKNCNEKFMGNVCEAIETVETFFSSVDDAIIYKTSINRFKVMTRINNVKKANRQLQKKIINLFPGITLHDCDNEFQLSFTDKLLNYLIERRSLLFVYLVTRTIDLSVAIKNSILLRS